MGAAERSTCREIKSRCVRVFTKKCVLQRSNCQRGRGDTYFSSGYVWVELNQPTKLIITHLNLFSSIESEKLGRLRFDYDEIDSAIFEDLEPGAVGKPR